MKKSCITISSLCILLQSCGDGGSGVASAPAPLQTAAAPTTSRTPLPPTPATTTGSYQGISTFTSIDFSDQTIVRDSTGRVVSVSGVQKLVEPMQLAPAGSINLTVDASTKTYTLTVNAGPYAFPAGVMVMPANAELGYTRNNPVAGTPLDMATSGDMLVKTVPAGNDANGAIRVLTTFVRLYNAGQLNNSPRYLSAAAWGQFYQVNSSGGSGQESFKPTQETLGFMVFGQRTQPGEMPLTGRASYTLHSLINPPVTDDDGKVTDILGSTMLDVDFATRGLAGHYDRTDRGDTLKTDDEGYPIYDDNGDPTVIGHFETSVHAAGSTTVSTDGSFNLALSGTGTAHTEQADQPPVPDIVAPVSGALNGAFFGPQAAEVGGIATLPQIGTDGTVYQTLSDFAGIRSIP